MKLLIDHLNSLFESGGLKTKRKSPYYYVMLPSDLIFVIYFQKSRWSDCYYINLGFSYKTILPKWRDVIAQRRLHVDAFEDDQCFNLIDEKLVIKLVEVIRVKLLPMLISVKNVDSLSKSLTGAKYLLNKKGQELLSINAPLS